MGRATELCPTRLARRLAPAAVRMAKSRTLPRATATVFSAADAGAGLHLLGVLRGEE